MTNLVAYIPVVNRQYFEWLKRCKPFNLYLITQRIAEALMPQLVRNMVALHEDLVIPMIRSLGLGHNIYSFKPLDLPRATRFVMPDEDISRLVAENYLIPAGRVVDFEQIRARWDMTAVKLREPIVPDFEVSSETTDRMRMETAVKLAWQSPDWWRQIGAIAFKDGTLVACSYNAHYPNEYETVAFGDPRLNFDAGEELEVYLSLHAEQGIVGICARDGISLKGASVYVTTFPCGNCARLLASCQIKELFFSEGYSVLKGLETLRIAGVRIVRVKGPESA